MLSDTVQHRCQIKRSDNGLLSTPFILNLCFGCRARSSFALEFLNVTFLYIKPLWSCDDVARCIYYQKIPMADGVASDVVCSTYCLCTSSHETNFPFLPSPNDLASTNCLVLWRVQVHCTTSLHMTCGDWYPQLVMRHLVARHLKDQCIQFKNGYTDYF